jgi:hypothetical protein
MFFWISSFAPIYLEPGRYKSGGTFRSKWLFLPVRRSIFGHKSGTFKPKEENMPKYVIEREIPGVGSLPPDQFLAISQKSCSVLKNLGPQIQWLESYVTADKIYCVYIAPNEAMVREHAKQGGFPANRISEVKRMIDPTSAEG